MARAATPAGASWSGLGVQYGDDVVYTTPFDTARVLSDLAFLRGHFNKLRLVILPFSASQTRIDNSLYIADQAKALGFRIIWGITANGTTLTSSNYASYASAVQTWAAMAEAHDVDEFIIGNEDEFRCDGTTLTSGTFRSNMRSLATTVKGIFSGVVSYNIAQTQETNWISEGIGGLDRVGLNNYGANQYDLNGFKQRLTNVYNAFGGNVYISEFNLVFDWTTITADDTMQANQLGMRLDLLRASGISEAYFFQYSYYNDILIGQGTNDYFALKLANGSYRAMWNVLTSKRDATPTRAATPARGATPLRGATP